MYNNIEVLIHYHGPVAYTPVQYPTDEDIDGRCPNLTAEEGWDMNIMSLSQMFQQSLKLKLQHNLPECFHDIIHLSKIAHISKKPIQPEILASIWNIYK